MKPNLSHLIPALLGAWLINAQVVAIPDPEFRQALLDHIPVIDTNGDLQIQVAEAEAFTGTMNVGRSEQDPGDITDLTGIEAFVNLDALVCDWNQIGQLDLSSNILLTGLTSVGNPLQQLELSENTVLGELTLIQHQLTVLDLANNPNIVSLICIDGGLQSLTLGEKPFLQSVSVQRNALDELDLTQAPELVFLRASDNQLNNLSFNANPILRRVFIGFNEIEQLDLSANPDLLVLDIQSNPLLQSLNLKNGNNPELDISGAPNSSNFQDLPALQTVCLDQVGSALAAYIQSQNSQPVDFTEDCSLGADDLLETGLSLSPNPVRDRLVWQAVVPVIRVEVFDITGKLLLEKGGKEPLLNIDMSSLKTGVYLLRFTGFDNQTTVKRVIKTY